MAVMLLLALALATCVYTAQLYDQMFRVNISNLTLISDYKDMAVFAVILWYP